MTSSIALVHKEAEGDFGVSFPDLPGCVTAGSTLDQARELAEEALSLHIEGLDTEGAPRPQSSTLQDVMELIDNRVAVLVLGAGG